MSDGAWGVGSGFGDGYLSYGHAGFVAALNDEAYNRSVLRNPVLLTLLARDTGSPLPPGVKGAQISRYALGQGKAAAVSSGTAATPTDTSAATVTLSPARHVFSRVLHDQAAAVFQGVPQLGPEEVWTDPVFAASARGQQWMEAQILLMAEGFSVWANTLMDKISALFSSATLSQGTSGAALTWADLARVRPKLKAAGATGPYVGLISSQQWLDLKEDADSVGGAIANSDAVTSMWNGEGTPDDGALLFVYDGVAYYLGPELDTSGDDVIGGVFCAAGVATKHQDVPLVGSTNHKLENAAFTVECLRGAGTSTLTVQTAIHVAAGILDANGILKLVTRRTA